MFIRYYFYPFSELKYEDEVNKLKAIYQTYAADLSKDSSHEIRAKLDDIKVQLKWIYLHKCIPHKYFLFITLNIKCIIQ